MTAKKGQKKSGLPQNKKYKLKKTTSQKSNNEIAGILLVSLGILTALSCYTQLAGVFGTHLSNFLFGIMGYSAYIIPFIIIFHGVVIIANKAKSELHFKIVYMLILCAFISAILHIFYSLNYREQHFTFDNIKEMYESGVKLESGGVIGGLLSIPVIKMFDVAGAITIFATFIVVIALLTTNISLLTVLKSFAKLISNIAAGISKVIDFRKNKKITTLNNKDSDINGNAIIHDNAAKQTAIQKNADKPKRNDDVSQKYEPIVPMDIQTKIQQSRNDGNYTFPPLSLLKVYNNEKMHSRISKNNIINDNARKLEQTLNSFGVEANVINVSKGPTITRYELQPHTGVKVSKIVNLADDIALNLAVPGVRIEAPIPGKSAVGIEVANKENVTVGVREVIETHEFNSHQSKIAFALGKDVSGKCIIADIAKMPHLLIAGATGSGKSVCINTIITSLLYKASPDDVRLLMIDTKVVELGVYNGIPHLLIPVVTDSKKAAAALNWAVHEMMQRYKMFADKGVRDIRSYNIMMEETEEKEKLSQIVILIDELADLMAVAPGEVEDSICRLAQMARAAGMHLVIATQRPSVDVITGLIKANIPSRISFAVSSQVDSRTILDMAGAEKLLGKGDMLYYPVGEPKPIRVQGTFVSDKEIEALVNYIKKRENAEYNEDVIEVINNMKGTHDKEAEDCDDLLPQAIEVVIETGQASASLIQRKFRVGYARAARMIDQMEARGIVGRFEGSKPRQVLINRQQWQEMTMNECDGGGKL